MLRLDLTYPSLQAETDVLLRYTGVAAEPAIAVSSPVAPGLVQQARLAAQQVHVSPELCGYVLAIAKASREHGQLSLGLSTRGALALLRAARITAGIEGAEFVTADEVKAVAPMVLPHRLMLTGDALLADVTENDVVARILEQVPAPR
jgi:MoxR-like ATPase